MGRRLSHSLANLVLSYQTVPWLPVNWFILTDIYIPALFDGKKIDWFPPRNRDFKVFADFWEKYLSYYAVFGTFGHSPSVSQFWVSCLSSLRVSLAKPKLVSIKSRILSCRTISFWARQIPYFKWIKGNSQIKGISCEGGVDLYFIQKYGKRKTITLLKKIEGKKSEHNLIRPSSIMKHKIFYSIQ